jgi:hypothetical protein
LPTLGFNSPPRTIVGVRSSLFKTAAFFGEAFLSVGDCGSDGGSGPFGASESGVKIDALPAFLGDTGSGSFSGSLPGRVTRGGKGDTLFPFDSNDVLGVGDGGSPVEETAGLAFSAEASSGCSESRTIVTLGLRVSAGAVLVRREDLNGADDLADLGACGLVGSEIVFDLDSLLWGLSGSSPSFSLCDHLVPFFMALFIALFSTGSSGCAGILAIFFSGGTQFSTFLSGKSSISIECELSMFG